MQEPPNTKPGYNPKLFKIIALFLGLAFVFIFCEILFRLMPQLTDDPPATPPHNYRFPHDLVGWAVSEGYNYEGEMRDFRGTPYPLKVTFGKSGFRKWGDPKSSKKKVLFIGDSYTACIQTSDEKLFYKILADSLPIEVFAYGAAGFSNTQEYIITEHYLNEINPDIVVWQLCSNDFIDNYWELEEKANYQVRMRRPYILEDGSIEYHRAIGWPRNVKPYSRFLYFLFKRYEDFSGKASVNAAERWIAEKNTDYEPFARSCKMTKTIFTKMKSLMPKETKLILFDADGFNPQYEQFARLCQECELPFLTGLDDFVRKGAESGRCVRADDGYHWNDYGNERVAEYLKKVIKEQL